MGRLLEYYEGTWAELAALLPPRSPHSPRPVLDVGLGGGLGQWGRVAPLPASLRDAVLDMHMYQAWTPKGISLFPQAWHLRQAACGASSTIRAMETAVAPVMVGEWSLALSDCATWLNGLGLGSGAVGTGVHGDCSRVACPSRFNNLSEGVSIAGGPDGHGMCPTGLLPSAGGPWGALAPGPFYALLAEYMVGLLTTYLLTFSTWWAPGPTHSALPTPCTPSPRCPPMHRVWRSGCVRALGRLAVTVCYCLLLSVTGGRVRALGRLAVLEL